MNNFFEEFLKTNSGTTMSVTWFEGGDIPGYWKLEITMPDGKRRVIRNRSFNICSLFALDELEQMQMKTA